MPVQITLIGSDGKGYTFLAKPKDDLRKDHRMMEVAGVINRLFAREPVSRRRNLYLRRHALYEALCMPSNAAAVKYRTHIQGLGEAHQAERYLLVKAAGLGR